MAEGDDGLGSHSEIVCVSGLYGYMSGQFKGLLTLSPIPPDQFFQRVNADDEGIELASLVLGSDIALSKVLLVDAIGVAGAGGAEQQIDGNNRAGGLTRARRRLHGSG